MVFRVTWVLGLLLALSLLVFAAGYPANFDRESGAGCDPDGPVRLKVEREGSFLKIRTARDRISSFRGDVTVTVRPPQGMRLVDHAVSWRGAGEERVLLAGDALLDNGEVIATAMLSDGQVVSVREPFYLGVPRNSVEGGRITPDGILEIPGILRRNGGEK